MSTKHVCDLCGDDATGPFAVTVLVMPIGNIGLISPYPESNRYGAPPLSDYLADLCADRSHAPVNAVRKRLGKPTWTPSER